MSEQIQVREGVWRTRDGREIVISLRDFGDAEPTSFVWFSKSTGEYETWLDNGRNTLSKFPQPLDLIEYLRPLPGTQAAPEPAPEAEAAPQPEQLREGVYRLRNGWEREIRHMGKALNWRGESGSEITWYGNGCFFASRDEHPWDLVEYVKPLPEPETTTDTLAETEEQIDQEQPWERLAVALQQQLTESLAERDRLQRELTDMANHAVELLESAQQARDERDILAQRLVTKHSEKALQKENSRKQIEINTLKDQLQDVTSDRDRLAGELANAQRLAADLRGEVDFVRTQKTAQEHQLRAAIARLQRELQQARIEIDAAGQQPAPADKSEQIERIWDESRERAVSEIIELLFPLQVATGTHAEAVLQILPAVIRRWMDGGTDDAE